MKYLLFLFLLVAAASCKKLTLKVPKDNACKVKEANKNCIKKSGEDPEVLQQIIEDRDKYKEDQRFNNYIYCGQKSLGFGKQDGTVNAKAFSKFFGKPGNKKIKAVFENCNKMKVEDPKETAARVIDCATKSLEYDYSEASDC